MLKKIGKIALMVAVMVGFCWATDALADGEGSVFTTARTKLAVVFANVRTIVFVLGAFTLVGFAVAAIFGKLEWKKVAILAVGLAILAVASALIKYVVGTTGTTELETSAANTLSADSDL